MSLQKITLDIKEYIAIITIDNPNVNNKQTNTLSSEVASDLEKALSQLENNINVRILIITGKGDKFFVAGAEINEFIDKTASQGKKLVTRIQQLFTRMENFPKPIIAAINGYCLGGGLELALSCDIRYASSNAKLGQPEILLGIIPGGGGTQRLTRLVGKGKAKEIMFTGDQISAEEALAIQLVHRVLPNPTELLEECRKLATKIANNSPLILSLLKEVIDKGNDAPLATGLSLEANAFGICFSTQDKEEGVKAFLEKRKPNFSGR